MPGELRRALTANMRRERLRLGFSQEELAARCDLHRTYIGGVERGERNITLSTLEKIAEALRVNPLELLERVTMAKKENKPVKPKINTRFIQKDDPEAVVARDRVKTMIDAIPPERLVESIKKAPSLRGMILGYVAELMFERHIPERYHVILSEHIEAHDDHNRDLNKSDRTITYSHRRYGIQLKSIQTNSIGRNPATGLLQADVQNDASDRRSVELPDGSTVTTTCYVRGQYSILAVPLFPFTGIWEFAYKRNRDCRPCLPSKRNGYTESQAHQLLSTTERITWPLSEAWETDLLRLLDDTIGVPIGQPRFVTEPQGKVRVVEAAAVILPLEDEEI